MSRDSYLILILLTATITGCSCDVSNGAIHYDCKGDQIPCTHLTYDLGSITKWWHNLFVEITHTKLIDSDGSDLYVDCGANQTMVLLQPVWTDLSISMAQVRAPASLSPTWTPYQGSQVPAFSASQVNVLYFSAQLPHSYLEGSDIEFHIHIAYPDNAAGNSVWYFTCSWANIDGTFPAPFLSPLVVVASPTTTDYHQDPEIVANLDGTGKTISSVLLCSIQRIGTHGSDDYANVIYLVSGDFHFQMDTMGSRTMLIK